MTNSHTFYNDNIFFSINIRAIEHLKYFMGFLPIFHLGILQDHQYLKNGPLTGKLSSILNAAIDKKQKKNTTIIN